MECCIAAEAVFAAGSHILAGEFQEAADEYREIPPRLDDFGAFVADVETWLARTGR